MIDWEMPSLCVLSRLFINGKKSGFQKKKIDQRYLPLFNFNNKLPLPKDITK